MYEATTRAQALAVLSICSSLLLALAERGVLDPSEVKDALEDAAQVHRNAAADGASPDAHREAVTIIERLMRDFDPDAGPFTVGH